MVASGEDSRTVSAASNWIIPAKGLSVASAVFGFTCLTVLVVATALNGESALATVALALAILAFTAQLILFVAQHALATEQARRSEEIFGLTQRVLAEISEKASGTQIEVQRISDRTEQMLPFIVSKNLAEAQGGQVDFRRLASDIERTLRTSDGDELGDSDEGESLYPPRHPRPDDAKLIQDLETYPDEAEANQVMPLLRDLDASSRMRLAAYAEDEIRARGPDSPFDPSLLEFGGNDLERKGLIEPYPGTDPSFGAAVPFRLTDLGRSVGRLLTANGEPPDYLPDLKAIRDSTSDLYPDWPPRDVFR